MSKSKTPNTTNAAEVEAPKRANPAAPKGKLGVLLALLLRPEGATLAAMQDATGWQAHSVRGALSGAIKKKWGFNISSEKTEAGRIYRATQGAGA